MIKFFIYNLKSVKTALKFNAPGERQPNIHYGVLGGVSRRQNAIVYH